MSRLILLILLSAQIVAAQLEVPAMHHLRENESLRAAKLTPAEMQQLIAEVEKTSFDSPDSWESELLARRVSLGQSEGLVIQGSNLLCGGTGNCQTWLFQHANGHWNPMFAGETAPIISGFGFQRQSSRGIRNLVTSSHLTAATASYMVMKFDGSFYRASKCYEVSSDSGESKRTREVLCK